MGDSKSVLRRDILQSLILVMTDGYGALMWNAKGRNTCLSAILSATNPKCIVLPSRRRIRVIFARVRNGFVSQTSAVKHVSC
jgi:hypothetical protein